MFTRNESNCTLNSVLVGLVIAVAVVAAALTHAFANIQPMV